MPKVCPSCELEYSDNEFFCAADGSPLRSTVTDADNLVGTIIADRYRVEAVIGEGGMGRVYRARHVRVPREAAIKVLRRALIADTYAIAAFNREARNAASVGDHPNVASVYDFGETPDGLVFLAMEFIDGETLSKRLEREPVLSPRRVVDIVRQIAAGLSAAHELAEPVVHRDLKPDNILLKATKDGTDWVKIVDFGIAKAAKRDTQLLTTPGLVVGTPRYMSPEQLTGGTIDVRSDIYALGMIAFQMLTGRMPFASTSRDDESTIQWALQRLTLQPLTLTQVRPDLKWSPAAQAALDGALATSAEDRLPTAKEFARLLANAFGLSTPSEAVGVVAEVPGPVSDAMRAAARSTAPTAPITAAPASLPRQPVSAARAAPPSQPVTRVLDREQPSSPPPPRASSRVLVASVGVIVIVAALAGLLWKRSAAKDPAPPVAVNPAPAPPVAQSNQPNASSPAADSATIASGSAASNTTRNKPTPAPVETTTAAQPAPLRSAPSAEALARAREALDRVKSAVSDQDAVVAAGTGPAIIRDIRQMMPAMPTRSDSVEAIYYLVEANLILDQPDEACRLLKRVRPRARGTSFLGSIDRYLTSPRLDCASRR